MPKFMIERQVPGAGKLTDKEIQEIAQDSCSVLLAMKGVVQWQQSYVTDDKIYCVYIAPNEEAVLQHAEEGGFPANVVARVWRVIDPTAAE
jgi:Nickel responsive protein SCO4226-like